MLATLGYNYLIDQSIKLFVKIVKAFKYRLKTNSILEAKLNTGFVVLQDLYGTSF